MSKPPEPFIARLPGYLPKGKRPCCLWCGKEMRPVPMREGEHGLFPSFFEKDHVCVRYGYEGRGSFCTLRCGYEYGMKAAEEEAS